MPGWAGQPEPRTDGPQECAWHCAPFTERAQYGIEVFWPWEGRTHIFRPGEPMLQILILPLIADFDLVAMDEEEAAEREMRGRRIHGSGPMLAEDTTWTSRSDAVFDGTYRHFIACGESARARTMNAWARAPCALPCYFRHCGI